MRATGSMLRATMLGGALLLVGAGWMPAPARYTGAIAVGVGELGTGAPISDAEVRLMELRVSRHTNWLGEAQVGRVPPGVWIVRVRKAGYASAQTQVIVGDRTVGPVFMLERLTARSDSAAPPARRPTTPASAFERHAAGGG